MKTTTKRPGRWKPGESGNPAGRPPGTGEVARLRSVIQGAIPGIIEKLVELALAGDAQAARLLLERTIAPLKASSAPAHLPYVAAAAGLADKATATLDAIATGKLPPDAGATLLAAIAQAARVVEIDDLTKRIELLEKGTKDEH